MGKDVRSITMHGSSKLEIVQMPIISEMDKFVYTHRMEYYRALEVNQL